MLQLDIKCKVCGNVLDAKLLSHVNIVLVQPCSYCLEREVLKMVEEAKQWWQQEQQKKREKESVQL